ncbi:hypothetical protein [uncultured Shewanella sp.]|uniref:hypothetical protein n=1 Tax=uncultured Shewanella sp. TaxID=173975 RepID=UPI00263101A6|nr:hypothetical protein [uncultured Shewanella sp.]
MVNKNRYSASRDGNSANADYAITNKGLKVVSTFSYSLTVGIKTSITLGATNSTQIGVSTSLFAGGKVGFSTGPTLDIKVATKAFELSKWKVGTSQSLAAKQKNKLLVDELSILKNKVISSTSQLSTIVNKVDLHEQNIATNNQKIDINESSIQSNGNQIINSNVKLTSITNKVETIDSNIEDIESKVRRAGIMMSFHDTDMSEADILIRDVGTMFLG